MYVIILTLKMNYHIDYKIVRINIYFIIVNVFCKYFIKYYKIQIYFDNS